MIAYIVHHSRYLHFLFFQASLPNCLDSVGRRPNYTTSCLQNTGHIPLHIVNCTYCCIICNILLKTYIMLQKVVYLLYMTCLPIMSHIILRCLYNATWWVAVIEQEQKSNVKWKCRLGKLWIVMAIYILSWNLSCTYRMTFWRG